MATWTFEEDFIVCEFYFEHLDNNWRLYIDELMARLNNHGFGQRDRGSAVMRVQNYEYLHTKNKGLSRACKQTRRVYEAFAKLRMSAIISSSYTNRTSALNCKTAATTTTYDHELCLEPLSSNYLSLNAVNIYNSMMGVDGKTSFWNILCKFIDQRGIKKDSEVYKSCCVGRDVFASIRKGNGVSKKTVFQLCFGLKLDADEAVVLLASAGFAFEDDKYPDSIVLKYLKERNYDIFAANIELYDIGAARLF